MKKVQRVWSIELDEEPHASLISGQFKSPGTVLYLINVTHFLEPSINSLFWQRYKGCGRKLDVTKMKTKTKTIFHGDIGLILDMYGCIIADSMVISLNGLMMLSMKHETRPNNHHEIPVAIHSINCSGDSLCIWQEHLLTPTTVSMACWTTR